MADWRNAKPQPFDDSEAASNGDNGADFEESIAASVRQPGHDLTNGEANQKAEEESNVRNR